MQDNRTVSLLLLGISVFALSSLTVQGQSSTQSKSLVNIDSQGIAAHGYDPVAFFSEGKANKGDSHWRSTYEGATYYFQSDSNREMFDKDPAKYAPLYGGYCAMAMIMGKLEDVDPNFFVVHDGKLLFQE